MNKSRSKKPYAQRLIPVVVMAIVLYTLADIALQVFKNVEISSTLTTCYFTFWGVEIVNLALIKFGKAKVKQPSEFGTMDTEQLNQEENSEG
jgi:Tfp pilus assembly major pilin PilA